MLKLIRTDSTHKDFIALVQKLDKDLALRDGEDHQFYNQFNSIEGIKYAIVVYKNTNPVGCGAIKQHGDSMEVKRMYVLPEYRGQGIATEVLKALEHWISDLGYKKCILETGKKQPEAINLYKKNGYECIENYGQYKGVSNSICFQKYI